MAAVAPLMAELAASGYEIESLDVLAQSKAFKNAIPILVKWLPEITNPRVKESIARTLSVPWSGPDVVKVLLTEFRTTSDSNNAGLKWAIGNTLEAIVDDESFDEIVELVCDKRHGSGRKMLVAALGKMKNPRAVDVLIGLLDDEEVVGHALIGLKKLKAQQARIHIERLINHPKAWVRKEAKQALVKMEA
jgi:hypothetical protein